MIKRIYYENIILAVFRCQELILDSKFLKEIIKEQKVSPSSNLIPYASIQ